jgi:hypothetical protein
LGERLLCKQEVIGSIPFTSTRRVFSREAARDHRHGAEKSAVLFFDMVKRECVAGRLKPFGSVSVFTRENAASPCGRGFPLFAAGLA